MQFLPKHLEWDQIISSITAYCHFDNAKEILRQKFPALDARQIEGQLDILSEVIELLQTELLSVIKEKFTLLPTDLPLNKLSEKLNRGGVLEIGEINSLLLASECFKDVRPKLGPLLFQQLNPAELSVPQPIGREISFFRKFVSKEGEADYKRHPVIGPLLESQIKIEQEILTQISQLINSGAFKGKLQYEEYDIVYDHYVLPVKSDSYSKNLGRIIARSDSGMTLLVEPFSVRELCLKRSEIKADVENEIYRLCREICDRISPCFDFFIFLQSFFIELDIVAAKGVFCWEKKLARPNIVTEPSFRLDKFFHPLVSNCIPNDISIAANKAGIIISGPNTGGKTVALKAMALANFFIHFGLFVPASFAEIFPFKGIFYFGNDNQDIEEGLSSFSSEVTQYLELVEGLQESNAIFIDEIFNTTSSEEASALALGFIDVLSTNNKNIVLLSTHHNSLKTTMAKNDRFLSGHVGFNFESNKPTYKLIVGSAGSSLALNIFENLKRNSPAHNKILEVARANLDESYLNYEHMISQLQEREGQVEQLIEENSSLNRELSNKLAAHKLNFKKKLDDEIQIYRTKFNKLLDQMEKLRIEQKSTSRSKKIIEEGHKLKREFEQDLPQQKESPLFQATTQIKEGEYYYHRVLQKRVKVISLDHKKGTAIVGVNQFKTNSNLKDLGLLHEGAPKAKQSIPGQIPQIEKSLEVDCRGMKLEEFIQEVEEICYAVEMENIPFCEIIHGHGNGVLKGWLRKFLKNQKNIEFQIPDGNDGATKILKKVN